MYYKQFMAFAFLLVSMAGFSQKETYSKISLPPSTQLNDIVNLGIDLQCGLYIDQDTGAYELIVSDFEKQLLQNRQIDYTLLVEDAATFYANRSANDLGNAQEQLRLSKEATPQPIQFQRLIEGNNNCLVDNFTTPQNFNLGTMGGMLTYDELLSELDEMSRKYPSIISTKNLVSSKKTVEGRPIYYVKISDNPNQDENEPEVLYDALHHAREPNGMMNLIYYMWYLLENYETDAEIQQLVNNTEMYFIPCINVDGYLYNEKTDPYGGGLWRKNRRRNQDGSYGVDLNRNYGYDWAKGGASSNPGSDTYHGPSAFSEPETQAIQEFVLKRDFKMAFNYHSYSGMILYPFGSPKPTTNPDYFYKIGEDVTQTNRYIYGDVSTVIYVATGGSDDWMYAGSGKEVYAFTPEIGRDSFWPSSSLILPECKENVRANLLLAYYAGRHIQVDDLTSNVVSTKSDEISLNIQKLGQTGTTYVVNVKPISSTIESIEEQTKRITIPTKLDVQKVSFDYTLKPSIQKNEEITYEISITCDDIEIFKKQFNKLYQPTVLFSSNEDNSGLANWDSEWAIASDAYSGSSSISHAPNGNYQNNEQKIITTNEYIDLTDVESAKLEYYAKWSIERMYDYAQIRVRKEGSNSWQPLCTPYTKPGAPTRVTGFNRNSDQPTGKPIYDGKQNSWVLETIDLSEYIGSKLLIRFVFDSDREDRQQGYNNTENGFYFDDFKVFATGKDDGGNDDDNPTDPNCETIQIDLTTDRYGSETSWQLTNKDGKVVLFGNNFEANKTYTEKKCLPKDCYTFTIQDSYGDGICCSYGNGNYSIKVNGKEMASGGEFSKQEQKEICLTDDKPDTEAPSIPLNLTASKLTAKSVSLSWDASKDNIKVAGYRVFQNGKEIQVLKSTKLKVSNLSPETNYNFRVSAFDEAKNESKKSTPLKISTPKELDCVTIKIELTTDNYANETAWTFKAENGQTIFKGENLEKNKTYTVEKCLPVSCYIFNITDSYGDGICCNYGDGGYKVYLNGNLVEQGGDFQQSEAKRICSSDTHLTNPALNQQNDNGLVVHNNPVHRGAMVSFETQSIDHGVYSLVNSQGDVLLNQAFHQHQHQFSSSNLQTGTYYLTIHDMETGQSFSKTIVIQ